MYLNTITKEIIVEDVDVDKAKDYVKLPETKNAIASLGDDLTWQPPLPKQPYLYDWDSINLKWVKR